MAAEGNGRKFDAVELTYFNSRGEMILSPSVLTDATQNVPADSEAKLNVPVVVISPDREKGDGTESRTSFISDSGQSSHYYEDVNVSFAREEIEYSGGDITPEPQNMIQDPLSDHSVSILKRLRYGKKRMRFSYYACFAMGSIYSEVEKFTFLEVFFFMLHVSMLPYGILNIYLCPAAPSIPVVLVISGFFGATETFVSVFLKAFREHFAGKESKVVLEDYIRITRFILLFLNLYGFITVYKILPPEDMNKCSTDFCFSQLYWICFSYFNLTTLTAGIVLLHMCLATTYYFI